MVYRVVESRPVTRLGEKVARALWPDLSSELTDVDLGAVGRAVEMPVCDVSTVIRMLIEAGVVTGVLRGDRCRLRRVCGTLRVYATMQDVNCEMVYLDRVASTAAAESTTTDGRRDAKSVRPILTSEEFTFACLLWSLGMSVADTLKRDEILRQAVSRGYTNRKAGAYLTALCRYNALAQCGRGPELAYKFRGVEARCLDGGPSDMRRYDGAER